jgi:hypothetical protein
MWHQRLVTWTRYIFTEHRTHVVPKRLAAAILHDLTTHHGAELETFDERSAYRHTAVVSECSIDFGGMWVTGSPSETVHLRGLTLKVPCHHVTLAIERLRRLKPRRVVDGGDLWYGLPYWNDALILLPQQYHSLLAQLVAVAPRAIERSDHFERGRAKVEALTIPVVTATGEIVRAIFPP